MTCKIVKKALLKANTKSVTLDVKDLSSAVYYVRMTDGNQYFAKKLLIQK